MPITYKGGKVTTLLEVFAREDGCAAPSERRCAIQRDVWEAIGLLRMADRVSEMFP